MIDQDSMVAPTPRLDSERLVRCVLDLLGDERHRDIVARRLGLFGPRETYAAIAASAGVTPQRVHQFVFLDRGRLMRQRNTSEFRVITRSFESVLAHELGGRGDVARVSELTVLFGSEQGPAAQNRITFLAAFCDALTVITDDSRHHGAVGLSPAVDEHALDALIEGIAAALARARVPLSSAELAGRLGGADARHVAAAASLSKDLRHLDELWGLAGWPAMDTRFVYGKIYAVLKRHRAPMRFSAIRAAVHAEAPSHALSDSGLRNELSHNPAFVRVGRGLYALAEERIEA